MRRAALIAATRILEADCAERALELSAASSPDAILLDLGLPDGDGVEVCRELRRWTNAPIIVVTDRDSQREKVRLLDLGADDYVTKPFDLDELSARLRAHLRRWLGAHVIRAEPSQRFGHLSVDLPGRTVRRHDREPDQLVKLTRTEWEILATLVANAGRTMTHAAIKEHAWPHHKDAPAGEVRMHVLNLRRKIERNALAPELIITESGVGYRFEPAQTPATAQ